MGYEIKQVYINVVSVMKYFRKGISSNWSYNAKNYDDNEVLITMAQDLLNTSNMVGKLL